MKNKNKILLIIVLLILIASLAGLLFAIKQYKDDLNDNEIIDDYNIQQEEETIEIEDDDQELWNANKEINVDYVGQVRFDSGIMDLPFVQASGNLQDYKFYAFDKNTIVSNYDNCESGPCSLNDVYLRTDWTNWSFDLGGSVFLDYRNSLYDQNIILYGHMFPKSMDPNKERMFSPLEILLKKENYEANKYITLVLDGEIRKYEVAYVYIFDTTSQDYNDLQYYRTNYEYDYYGNPDEGYYQKYIDNMKKKQQYDTGVELTKDDNTLTLQTCVEGSDTLIELVVCKELNK